MQAIRHDEYDVLMQVIAILLWRHMGDTWSQTTRNTGSL